MKYTGRVRTRWFFFTQFEYSFRGMSGRGCTPHNFLHWPICFGWTYRSPEVL